MHDRQALTLLLQGLVLLTTLSRYSSHHLEALRLAYRRVWALLR